MEKAFGLDSVRVGAFVPMLDRVREWKARWRIDKFKDPSGIVEVASRAGLPLEDILLMFSGEYLGVEEFEGNLLLNEGINAMWTLICGGSETAFNNANARIGVGNSNAAASADQTGLQGASTAFKAMDSGYPTFGSGQKATFRSTFGSADGNFAWEEITVDNGATPNKNLNRKVQSMGTKASGTTWVATLEITLS